jgi:hypothetical protein
MKTEDWVSMLATGVDAIDRKRTARRHFLAITGGLLAALAFTGGILRFNPALSNRMLLEPMFWVREAYCAVLALFGFVAVARLARPGIRLGFAPAGVVTVVLVMWTLAATVLLRAPAQNRSHLLFGTSAAVCPFLIALVAVPLFIAILWVLRDLAPTRLRLAGAAAGFAAGSLGALVYSLHCPELAAPFVGTWYLLGMLIPTSLGAWLGPRLIRW